jgi:hypothetical protein
MTRSPSHGSLAVTPANICQRHAWADTGRKLDGIASQIVTKVYTDIYIIASEAGLFEQKTGYSETSESVISMISVSSAAGQ